jgi:hypothetical protein
MEPVTSLGIPRPVATPESFGSITGDGAGIPDTVEPQVANKGFESDYDTINNLDYVPDYSPADAFMSGFRTTMLASVYDAYNSPAFEPKQGYKAHEQTTVLEQQYGYEFDEEQRDYLADAVSPDEFAWRQGELAKKQENTQSLGQHPVFWLGGAIADADLAAGYGLGKISALGKLSRTTQRVVRGVTIGTIQGGGFTYAQSKLPITNGEILMMTLGNTIGGMFWGTKGAPKLDMSNVPNPANVITKAADTGVTP